MEIWKDIDGYESLYQVSNLGSVKSIGYGKERILKPFKNAFGYLMVGLHKNGKQKNFTIHRLTAQAFIPNLEQKEEVDHINTIKTDNRVENLRWVTRKENINNPLSLKNKSIAKKGHIVSEETKRKMSESQKGLQAGGKNPRAKKTFCGGMIFSCAKECAEYYGVKYNTMKMWLLGRNPMPEKFKELGLKYIA